MEFCKLTDIVLTGNCSRRHGGNDGVVLAGLLEARPPELLRVAWRKELETQTEFCGDELPPNLTKIRGSPIARLPEQSYQTKVLLLEHCSLFSISLKSRSRRR